MVGHPGKRGRKRNRYHHPNRASLIPSNNSTTKEIPDAATHTAKEEEAEAEEDKATRVLYTVTTLSEYNSGKRHTKRGSDRFNETLIPIVSESVSSMIAAGYHVDVYLISGFIMTPQRRFQLKDALPRQVGLEIWDDALPYNYNMKDFLNNNNKKRNNIVINPNAKLEPHARGLARQHRFVLKDKLPYYDMFVSFEDDMLIKGSHIFNYQQMVQHLEQLRKQAPTKHNNNPDMQQHLYFGKNSLTQNQLRRIIPGFMRVEAVLNETLTPIPPLAVSVPVDMEYDDNNHTTTNITIDAAPCCHVSNETSSARLPAAPTSHQLIAWETQILPLGVRQMPPLPSNTNYTLDWVMLQRGTPGALPDYWSGNDGYYQNDTVYWRPQTLERKYVNNQGGYMATRQQLVEWHLEACQGGFLPPFSDVTTYGTMDGLDLRDVEYWSGGIQLIGLGCKLQRIINLDPTAFSRHILYHTANNKQEQLQGVRERFTRLDELWGMLNAVRKNAQRAMPYFQQQQQDGNQYTLEHHKICQAQHYLNGTTRIQGALPSGAEGGPCLVATV
ncbi:expressed unknown protein [Seminavis robusta]|uniref:Glycosyltransferase family 92 protein n=1 Tax=Seminavis robusta TaxID=568900 RepID=A0A9N8HMK5_9STRA|nr:expressed unknown protein [Seminavis robusta]|eukprot:Sro907_g218740.1 n/a (556) ;mRNA; f:12801-14468